MKIGGGVVLIAAMMLAGCAHVPQANRAAKADKYAAPKAVNVATPNQIVKKRWMPKFKIKWLHSK